MSSSDNQKDSRSVSEDRSRNWANNVIEKSAGGRVKKNNEPKLNWLMIIGVFILIVIVIIYFSYNNKPDGGTAEDSGAAIEAVNNPALTETTVPVVPAVTV